MLSFETFSYLIHQNEYMNIFISTFVFQFIDQHLNFSFIVDNFTILAIVYWLGKGGNWNECKKYFWFVEFLEDSGIQVLKPFLFLHFPFSFHWHRRCSSNLQIGQAAGPVMMSFVSFSCPKTALAPNKVQPLSSGSSFAQNEK